MKIYIAKRDGEKANRLAKRLIDSLKKMKLQIVSKPKEADLIFSVGGDGTLFYNVQKYISLNIPFVGVNAGSVGYQCYIQEETFHKDLMNVINGKNLKKFTRLDIETSSGLKEIAIQEARIERSDHHAIVMKVKINKRIVSKRHLGDGVIISNSFGATGYNISAGGPMKINRNELSVTPICPYTLGLHIYDSVAEPKTYKNPTIEIVVEKEARLVLDNKAHLLPKNEKVKISLGKKSFSIHLR